MTIKNKMPKRIYKCSDGMLDRLASYTLKNINRDQAKLSSRGIDAASIANFELLYEAFRLSDNKKIEKVFVIAPIGDDIAVAINDRLDKAAGSHSQG
jgi:hypothetical protein